MCVVTFDWEENDAIEKVKSFQKNKLPCWAVVEVTGYCNFNCKWCFANAASNLNPIHMEKEKAESLIETLAANDVTQVTFSGGEPTLYPYLKDIIKKTRDHGMIAHMNTNGFLLSKEFARELKDAGLSQVQINIDSLDPDRHDYIRGKKGSFHRAIQALKNAREAGLTCVSQTVLTKENENEIIDIFRFARSMGIQRCRVWDMTPSEGCAKDNIDLKPTDYINTLMKLSKFAHETGAQHIESGDPLFPGVCEPEINTVGGLCVGIIGAYITISYEGDVFFCATQRKPLYNIFDLDGRDLGEFHRDKLRHALYPLDTPPKCMSCRFIKKCQGGCYTRRISNPLREDYYCPIINSSGMKLGAPCPPNFVKEPIA